MPLRLPRIHFDFCRCADNRHGEGHAQICGPRFRVVRLGVYPPSTGTRWIFYWPSGAWGHFDVYVDRRDRSKWA